MVALADHLCYLLIANQLKTVKNQTSGSPFLVPFFKLYTELGRVLGKTAEEKPISVPTLL